MSQQRHNSFFEALADGLGCLLPMLLFLAVIILGCGGFIQFTQEEMKKAEAKRETIEGVVEKVESYIVEPPVETEEEKEKKKNRTTITIGPGHVRERTKVTFQDGRSKEFFGVFPKPMDKGKYYIITFNGFNRVVEINEKEDKPQKIEPAK